MVCVFYSTFWITLRVKPDAVKAPPINILIFLLTMNQLTVYIEREVAHSD